MTETNVRSNKPLRILVLSPTEPFPPQGGWPIVIYNDIKYLALRGHRLAVLAVTHDPSARTEALAPFATGEYFLVPKPFKWRQVLTNLGHSLPYTIERYHDDRLLGRAVQLIREGGIDVVLIEDVVMGRYAELIQQVVTIPTFLRGHNISTIVAARYYQATCNPVIRYLAWRQYVKWRRYETQVVETFDGISQISPADAAQMEALNPARKNEILFSGVDLDYFSFTPPEQRDPVTVVHVGSLDPITKLPAMLWFYDKVWPHVRKRVNGARLEIAGNMPPCRLQHGADQGVVVHGRLPDVRPLLAKGAVFIAPQFVGSGIRIKILNAMATGNAVVCTPVACEGLPVTQGEDIFIADNEKGFSETVCHLLENPTLRAEVGRRARKLMENQFAWPRIAEQLEEGLSKAIQRRAKS